MFFFNLTVFLLFDLRSIQARWLDGFASTRSRSNKILLQIFQILYGLAKHDFLVRLESNKKATTAESGIRILNLKHYCIRMSEFVRLLTYCFGMDFYLQI